MKILYFKILIFNILLQALIAPDTSYEFEIGDQSVQIKSSSGEIGINNVCSIVKSVKNSKKEILLICHEYEIPKNIEFYSSSNEDNKFKFILKSFYISRIVPENTKHSESIKIGEKEEDYEQEIDAVNKCLGDDFYSNAKSLKKKMKECKANFLNIGNLMGEEKTLEIGPSKEAEGIFGKSNTIIYDPSQNQEIENDSKYFIALKIDVSYTYLKRAKKHTSIFSFSFYIDHEGTGVDDLAFTTHIISEELNEKLLKQFKAENIEEGEGLFFKYPSKNEKEKIKSELEKLGLTDLSSFFSSMRIEEN